MKLHTHIKRSLFLVLIVIAVLIVNKPIAVNAVSASDWQAGSIIDDRMFYNGSDMSASDIQGFLNGKVPSCDTWGSKIYSGGQTRAQYGASRGYPAPYVCMRDYSMTIPGYGADAYCSAIGGGNKSAAQIIKDVSQSCGIGSKVLLVLLQKEQSLVTDDWPWPSQYQKATGFACPDTAPCDSQYAGFFNQVYRAARQYKVYRANPASYRYKARQNNAIQFNPNAGCGSSNVYIANDATAGLYIYTPYQPNQAALNNMYGTGDGCSAYGNRNFWRMYNDWFGSTNAPAFRATYDSQSPYPVIDSGNGISVFFQFKNTGTAFWKDDLSNFPGYRPVRLATTTPINRGSAFRASNWSSAARPTGIFSKVLEGDGVTLAPEQHTVQPGQIARFEFTIHVDPNIPPGVYREYFQPIVEGAPGYEWNMDGGVYLDIGVNRPVLRAAFSGQSPYATINKGSSGSAHLAFKNVGNDPWFDDTSTPIGKRPVRLATSWPINRLSDFGTTWPFRNRPNTSFSQVYQADGVTLSSAQHTVQPGQIAKFDFTFTVPANQPSGVYREYFEPIVEGAPGYGWNMGTQAWLSVTVP